MLAGVEEDPLADHQLEQEILGGKHELFERDVIEDLDYWVVSHSL